MTNVVHSRNGGVWTTLSGEVRNFGPPGTPIVSLSPADGQIVVNWTAPLNGGSAITGYAVTKTSNGTTTTDNVASTVYSDTVTITNGVELTVTVTATNAIGSTISSPVSGAASAATEGAGYTIPAGFMTLATVGPNASDAPLGPKTRAQSSYAGTGLAINSANQTVNGGYFKTITLGNSVTKLNGIYVDNNSQPAINQAQIMVDGGAGTASNSVLVLGSNSGDITSPPLTTNSSPLLGVPPTLLNNTKQVEVVYFACSGLDSNKNPIYAAPTQVSGGWQYQIYNPSTSDHGFAYGHGHGRFVFIQGSTGFAVHDNGKPAAFPAMWMIAQFCQFGNPNGGNQQGAGGAVSAIDSQQGTLYSRCGIGFNGDATKIAGRTWFDNCVIGPNLAPSADPGYHSDGFQVVGGINNDPTGSTWLDLNHPLSTSGGSVYGYASSQVDSNTLHVFGNSWTVAYHCCHIGFSSYVSSPGVIKYIHAPFFLASNAGDPGEVQNLLIDSGFITGGFNMILDNTSVNSINTGNIKGFNNGVGGDKGVIFRRNTFEFIAAGQGSTQATIAQAANAGDTELIVTVIGGLTGQSTCIISGATASQNETVFVIDDPIPVPNSTYFLITITTNLSGTTDATDANAVGLVYGHAVGAAVHGSSSWNAFGLMPNGNQSNGYAPNVAKTYNPSANSPGQILQNTTYKYTLAQAANQGDTSLQLTTIQPTARTDLGSGIGSGQLYNVISFNDGTGENVHTTGVASYNSSTGIMTVPIASLAHNHAASQNVVTDLPNWVEVSAGFNYSTADPNRNYWELSNVRSDTGAVITLTQAQWIVSQWLGQ